MSGDNVEEARLSDDQILEHNQKIRMQLVGELVKDGMPTDKDDKYLLLAALKDADKQVVDKKRVAIEDKNTNVANVVAMAVSKIAQMVDNGDPFKRQNAGQIPVADPALIPQYTPVPGEMEIGVTSENYDDFMARNGRSSRDAGIE